MSDVNQPRQPEGAPGGTGGQFKGTGSGDAAATLPTPTSVIEVRQDMDIDAYNSRGSYYFPPRPLSATQLLDFYFRVADVPPEVCMRVLHGYHTSRVRAVQSVWEQKEYHHRMVQESYSSVTRALRGGSFAEHAQRQGHNCPAGAGARTSEQCADHFADLEYKAAPFRIQESDVRDLILADRCLIAAGALPDDEREKVLNFVIETQAHGDISIADAAEKYWLFQRVPVEMRPALSSAEREPVVPDVVARIDMANGAPEAVARAWA